jgi:hypothetical protein
MTPYRCRYKDHRALSPRTERAGSIEQIPQSRLRTGHETPTTTDHPAHAPNAHTQSTPARTSAWHLPRRHVLRNAPAKRWLEPGENRICGERFGATRSGGILFLCSRVRVLVYSTRRRRFPVGGAGDASKFNRCFKSAAVSWYLAFF